MQDTGTQLGRRACQPNNASAYSSGDGPASLTTQTLSHSIAATPYDCVSACGLNSNEKYCLATTMLALCSSPYAQHLRSMLVTCCQSTVLQHSIDACQLECYNTTEWQAITEQSNQSAFPVWLHLHLTLSTNSIAPPHWRVQHSLVQ
jgi:hypothetical protein